MSAASLSFATAAASFAFATASPSSTVAGLLAEIRERSEGGEGVSVLITTTRCELRLDFRHVIGDV